MERFGLDGFADEATLTEAPDAIAADLARLDDWLAVERVVGMGGARQIEVYRTRDADQRREVVGLQANRAPVILAGACIVRSTLATPGRESLAVSDRGLRHGLPVERFPHPT